MRGLLAYAQLTVSILIASAGSGNAATTLNARSPLGINLAAVSYYSTEQPFSNIFVTNDGWITHGHGRWDTHEEQYLQLDANGYPKTLRAKSSDPHTHQLFNSVGVLLERQGGKYLYPAGRYVVLYDGRGTLTYGFDAKLVSSSPGRDVIDVARPSDAGIDLRIIRTDPSDHIRNIRVISERNELAFDSGQLFTSAFIDLLKRFRVIRFMDWSRTNGSAIRTWSERPVPSFYTWATPKGVPIEIAIRLANAVSADAWLNVPAMADDNYIEQMATLVHRQLGRTQSVYLEYSNEVWNSSFPQYGYAKLRGQARWPDRTGGGYKWNRNWYGMRTAQMCDIWKRIWGSDRKRVICVLSAQAADTYSATESLDCPYWIHGAPCAEHGIGAVAIAPYFGEGDIPWRWLAQPDHGLALLFATLAPPDKEGASPFLGSVSKLTARLRAALARHDLNWGASNKEAASPTGGWFREISGWESGYAKVLERYHLPLIAYEGGQSFVGGSNPAATKLFIAANRDPRMGAAYTEYLNQWKSHGGELLVLYNDVGSASQFGEWGGLESIMQLNKPYRSLPPKWRAIEHFISSTPCWWKGCGSIDAARDKLPPPSAVRLKH